MSRSSSRRPYAIAVVFMGLLVGAAWLGRGRFTPVTVGTAAPTFTATNLDGEEVSLDDYRGRVLLVNVWATWCAPCREEMPSMERLYADFEGDDFEILAVSIDAPVGASDDFGRKGGDLDRFAREYGLTFPILHDPEGRIQDLYQTTGVPESFIIGRDGVIVRRLAGATVWDAPQYRELIRRLLDEGGGRAAS